MRILVVEDDAGVANFIRRGFREQQYAVDLAADGEEALHFGRTEDYDAIVLDLQLPERDGLEVLHTLRREGKTMPILILTAKEDLPNKVAGLDGGADDYLTKPFHFEELLARVRALLRRGRGVTTVLKVADLELDPLRHEVRRNGKRLDLTNREYAILDYLMRNAGCVVTRTMLMEHVWDYSFDPMSNVIEVHISRLRSKVDDDSTLKLLHTIRGTGYCLRLPDAGQDSPAPQATPSTPRKTTRPPAGLGPRRS